jgi:hypothetical protein
MANEISNLAFKILNQMYIDTVLLDCPFKLTNELIDKWECLSCDIEEAFIELAREGLSSDKYLLPKGYYVVHMWRGSKPALETKSLNERQIKLLSREQYYQPDDWEDLERISKQMAAERISSELKSARSQNEERYSDMKKNYKKIVSSYEKEYRYNLIDENYKRQVLEHYNNKYWE